MTFNSVIVPESDPNISGWSADPDHDGRSNHDEYLAGTSPLNHDSFPQLALSLASVSISLSFDLPMNRSAQIETSPDLKSWNLWNMPGNAGLPLPGGTASITGSSTNSHQFFRLRFGEN